MRLVCFASCVKHIKFIWSADGWSDPRSLSLSKILSLSGAPLLSSPRWANLLQCTAAWKGQGVKKRTPLMCSGWGTARLFSTLTPTSSKSTLAATVGRSSALSGRWQISLLSSAFVVTVPKRIVLWSNHTWPNNVNNGCFYFLFLHFILLPRSTSCLITSACWFPTTVEHF